METHAKIRGASVTRRKAVEDLDKAWLRAGAPRNYKVRWTAGKGTSRIWDQAARRERLSDLRDPGRVAVRMQKGRLMLRQRKLAMANK